MVEGVLISLVGMGAVFVSLTIIMFLMMGIERGFRVEGPAIEEGLVSESAVVYIEREEERVEPEGLAEVAAIALALTTYLKERGRELGESIKINDEHYHIDMGDTSCQPTSISVNGDKFWCAVGGDELPFSKRTSLWIPPRDRDAGHERYWRSAHPPSIGGYWARRGWTGRHGTMTTE